MRRRSKLSLLALLALGMASCTADLQHRAEPVEMPGEEPPILVSRTGVPILMDIPVLGFLFGRTIIVR